MVQKTGPVSALITLRRLAVERRVIGQKFQDALEKKRLTSIVDHLNIFLPNLHESLPPEIQPDSTVMHGFSMNI